MSFFNREKNKPTDDGEAVKVNYRESAGKTIDDEDKGWRKITEDSKRDLSGPTYERSLEIAYFLWQSNPLANRLIELPIAFLFAEGVSWSHPEPDCQDALSRFWNDPINKMGQKIIKKSRELALYGVQCWPAFVNELNGHVRLGYIDPADIDKVITDPDNIEQPIGIITKRNAKFQRKKFQIIINGAEDVFTERTQQVRQTFRDGQCFYFTVNALSNGKLGRSDLVASADWLDAFSKFLTGEVDRADFLKSFLWDVTLEGAQPDEVKKRAKEIHPPGPNSVRVHNEKEKWATVTPDIQASDMETFARVFRNHILGGQTIPEHWFGGGGDVNRATGESMSEPVLKVLTMRQTEIKNILLELATFVLRQKELSTSNIEPELNGDCYKTTIEMPEMTAKDTSRYAAALGQIVVAVQMMTDNSILTEEKALQMISSIAAQLGVDIDPAEELKKAKKEAAEKSEDDVFGEGDDKNKDVDDE